MQVEFDPEKAEHIKRNTALTLLRLSGYGTIVQQFMKAEEFDKAFDESGDITPCLDLSKARRIQQEHKRVNVDFPVWMIDSLDKEATRLGVSRQSVIKVWLGERLQQQKV